MGLDNFRFVLRRHIKRLSPLEHERPPVPQEAEGLALAEMNQYGLAPPDASPNAN